MQLKRIRLRNYCNHRDTTLEFKSGLTAIVGRNGCGKSNVLDGIKLALTGSSSNSGKKQDNINCLATKKEKSSVELEFEHAGVSATVARFLRPAQPATLTFANGRQVLGEEAVNNEIASILGVDAATIHNIVVVSQKDLFGFITHTPAERAKHFQSLFATDVAERVHQHLSKHIKTYEFTNWQPNIDSKIAEIVMLSQQLVDAVAADSQVLADADPYAAGIAALRAEQHKLRAIADLTVEINNAERSIAAGEYTLSVMQDRLNVLRNEYQLTEADLAKLLVKKSEAEAQLAEAAANRQYEATYRAQTANRSKLQSDIALYAAAVVSLEAHADFTRVMPEHSDMEKLMNQCAADKQLLESSVCPTCGVSKQMSSDELNVVRARLDSNAAVCAEYSRNLQAFKKVATQIAAYKNQIGLSEAQLATVEATLATLPSTFEIPDTREAQALLEAIQEKQKMLQFCTASGTRESNEVSRLTGTLAAERANLANNRVKLVGLGTVTAPEVEIAAKLQNHVLASQAWTQSKARYKLTEEAVARCKIELEGLNARAAKSSVDKLWVQELESVAAMFHRDAAPRYVAFHNLKLLAKEMNSMLELFDAEYRVHAEEDLSFVATFFDGRRQLVERLSGGQSVIIALVFRLAVNVLFADSVNAIFLDEPTAFQDEHHIKGFAPVLAKLRDYSSKRGLQCFIVTHERDLAPLFDNVISLG